MKIDKTNLDSTSRLSRVQLEEIHCEPASVSNEFTRAEMSVLTCILGDPCPHASIPREHSNSRGKPAENKNWSRKAIQFRTCRRE